MLIGAWKRTFKSCTTPCFIVWSVVNERILLERISGQIRLVCNDLQMFDTARLVMWISNSAHRFDSLVLIVFFWRHKTSTPGVAIILFPFSALGDCSVGCVVCPAEV